VNPSHAYNDKLDEYKHRIRCLHDKRDKCLHSHRDKYFYPDVEVFLQTATLTQMKSYLHNYETAIQHSTHEAAKLCTRPIFHFTGFTRRKTQPPLLPPPSRSTSYHPPMSTANRGDKPIRKHTRWRQISSALRIQSIRNFFSQPPPT
jgi:hypothetical protein